MNTTKLKETLERDRQALSQLHIHTPNLTSAQYNALLHAIWNIDTQLGEL